MTRARLLLSCVFSTAARALLRPLALLPIRKNRVLFLSFRGKQYSCNPKYVSQALQDLTGKRILLVDDVRTSGSTAADCARALKEAGAGKVCLAVSAVVYRRSQ